MRRARTEGADRVPAGCPPVRRPGFDLTRIPLLAWWLRRRSWQFQLVLASQVVFWAVIVSGFVGVDEFELNVATTITWFVWFSAVFVLIAVTGRGWCAVCPLGGGAEWIQRRRLWHGKGPDRRRPGSTRPVPQWLSRYGYLPTALLFGLLTWIEEYYRVSEGSSPALTSWTLIGIGLLAVLAFLAFERRAFCRHLCPLGGLIGVLGIGAPVAGFRARDRSVCLRCTTRECLSGSDRAYGCPWFNWPGGSDANVNCGLCGECLRACPSDNVGLFVDRPFAALSRATDRRGDVAWTVAIIAGITAAQHARATQVYLDADNRANDLMQLSGRPNPVLFVVVIAALTVLFAAPAWGARVLLYRRPLGGLDRRDDSYVYRVTPFRMFFLPFAYAAIPLLTADLIAVGLMTFTQDSFKAVAAAGWTLGVAPDDLARWQSGSLLGEAGTVRLQVAVLLVGTVAALVVAWRAVGAQTASVTRSTLLARAGACVPLALAGAMVIFTYVGANGAVG